MNNLPEEILLEILTRLPTESAIGCKLVCKSWRDLVRHPSFSQTHLNHLNEDDSRDKVSFIFEGYNRQQRPGEFYYTEYEENCDEILLSRKTRMNLFYPEYQYCDFVGSCNGLICLKLYSGRYYICNPIIREYVKLPNLEGGYQGCGFGYCPSTNEYKVVRIGFTSKDPKFGISVQVYIYTLGGGNGWRNLRDIDLNRKGTIYLEQFAGVFANVALHWVIRHDKTVLAFRLTDEKFSEFPLPHCLPRASNNHLVVLGDFLSVTCSHHYDNHSQIWLLKKNKDNSDLSWSKELSFNRHIQLLLSAFMKSGRLLYYQSGGGIYSYDTSSERVDVAAKIDVGFGISVSSLPISHKNTLVSLKALGEKETKTMGYSYRARSNEVT